MAFLSPIYKDYCNQSNKLSEYFDCLPGQLENKINQLKNNLPVASKQLVSHLIDYNKRLGAPDICLDNINLLASGAVVVMTGQQPGLITGPLYTIYKAATCIRLAQYITKTYNIASVPVFWNAAEDHDLAEINQAHLPDQQGQYQKIELQSAKKYSEWGVGEIPLGEWTELEEQLKQALPPTEFNADILNMLADTWSASSKWGEWFSRIMHKLFGKYGLILADPNEAQIRRLIRPIWKKLLDNPLLPAQLVGNAGEKLRSIGYKPQLIRAKQSCSFFMFENKKRLPVSFNGNHFRTNDTKYSPVELRSIIKEEPQRLSPSVVLRPIAAEYLFNSAIYVAGPGEIAYFPQLKPVYKHFNISMPLIWPRESITIIEGKIEKVLNKYTIAPVRLQEEIGRLLNEITRDKNRLASIAFWDQLKRQVLEPLRKLGEDTAIGKPQIQSAIKNAASKIDWQLNQLETKTIQLCKKLDSTLVAQLTKAKNNLFPAQQLQERELNLFYFLNKHGLSWLDGLIEAVDLEYNKHHFVTFQILPD